MHDDLQRSFGRSLRAHRHSLGLSQEALAQRLHVHRTYLGGIERGERNLTFKVAERIASQLGLDPIDMLRSDKGG